MRRHLWWVLGLVLVAAGVVVALSARAGPDDFGHLLAAPPDVGPDWLMGFNDTESSGSLVVLTPWQVVGCVLAALGLLVVAAGLGFRLGRRGVHAAPHSARSAGPGRG